MSAPTFLSLADVLDLHADQIRDFGGIPGVRDLGLLESAVAQARAGAFGAHLHSNLFEMAAAYLFHIARNHPFLDGNKRTALFAALVFLEMNGDTVVAEPLRIAQLVISVSEGRADKAVIAEFLRQHANKRR